MSLSLSCCSLVAEGGTRRAVGAVGAVCSTQSASTANDCSSLATHRRSSHTSPPWQKLQYLKGRVERIRQVFHSFKTELRELTKSEARPFEEVRVLCSRVVCEREREPTAAAGSSSSQCKQSINAIQCNAIQCNAIQSMQCNPMQCQSMQSNAMQSTQSKKQKTESTRL